MIVLITGGRDYKDTRTIFAVLDRIHSERHFSFLVHGDAPGADQIAHRWAKKTGVQPVAMDALWDVEGDAAGTKRNKRMWNLFHPTLVIAFPGGTGTANMMKIAYDGGAELIDVEDINLDDPNPVFGVTK